MFTGIIETIGTITHKISKGENIIWGVSSHFTAELINGQSISINGACHTKIEKTEKDREDVFFVESIKETLDMTALKYLEIDDEVNLERCMPVNGRFDGHIVQGHVDGIGVVEAQNSAETRCIVSLQNSQRITIKTTPKILHYCVYKGSITIDGIALTLTKVTDTTLSVDIIPHTWEQTIISNYIAGRTVNLETDIMARYLDKWNTLS
jgi:riboflavin synthase